MVVLPVEVAGNVRNRFTAGFLSEKVGSHQFTVEATKDEETDLENNVSTRGRNTPSKLYPQV